MSIHRVNCSNLLALTQREPERVVEVAWGHQTDALYPVELLVMAQDRQGLLRDISEVFAREKINVIGVNTSSAKGEARMLFTVEVGSAARCQPGARAGARGQGHVRRATPISGPSTACCC